MYLKKSLGLGVFLFLFFQSFAFCAEGFDKDDFRRYVKEEMKEWNAPGAAVLLIKDGKVIFSEGFGYRDIKRKLPVDSKTVFPIASCTKTFASFAAGLLVDEGRIDWDIPVREYFPQLMMYDSYTTGHITLRDILCHRSGLPRHDRVWMYAGLSRDDLMSRLKYLEADHGFREAFEYNNIVYSISGVVVEKITEMRWEDFVKKRIFVPLGMKNSSLFIDDIKNNKNHALPYVLRDSVQNSDIDNSSDELLQIPYQAYNTTGPASCINSNLEDMAKWILLHINEGKVDKKQLISTKTIKEIHSPQMTIPVDGEFKPFVCEETPVISYGLGWVVQPFRGRMMLNHSGGVDGFSAIIAFMPEEKAGVVVLTNLQTNMLPYIIAFNFFDRLLGAEQVNRGEKLRQELKILLKQMQGGEDVNSLQGDFSPSHPLKDYAGKYVNPAYGVIDVSIEGDKLYAVYRAQKAPLEHLQYDVFRSVFLFPSGKLDLRMTFDMLDSGQIGTFTTTFPTAVRKIRFRKLNNYE